MWLVRDGRLESRTVEAGPVSGGFREIRSGLSGGEMVLVGGVEEPEQGMRVEGQGRSSHRITASFARTQGHNRARNLMALVEIRDVDKVFHRDAERIEVFTGLTLDFEQGNFTALMGPSGSGKSTLLNLMAGLDKPTSGTVRVNGAEVSAMTPAQLAAWRARNIGFVFQSFNLLPVLTAFQNVELPLLLTRLSKKERDERIAIALGVVGLDDRMDHYPAPALRRTGAARRHRARHRGRPDAHPARRADRPARREELAGGAGAAPAGSTTSSGRRS